MSRVLTTERPTVVTTTTRVNGQALAGDLFQQRVGIDPSYLKRPSGLLCARGTLIDRSCYRLIPLRCKKRTCEYCRLIMAWRRLRQIQHEGILRWGRVDDTGWQACRRRHNYHGASYLAFPQGGVVVIISSLGECDLPTVDFIVPETETMMTVIQEIETVKLVDTWIENVPQGKRIRPSRGFGGERWAGARAKPEKGRYVRLGRDVEIVVAGIKAELTKQARALQSSERDLSPDFHGIYNTTGHIVKLALELNGKTSQ